MFIYEKEIFRFPGFPSDAFKKLLAFTLYIRSNETDLLFLNLICYVSVLNAALLSSQSWLGYSIRIRSTSSKLSNLIPKIVSKKGVLTRAGYLLTQGCLRAGRGRGGCDPPQVLPIFSRRFYTNICRSSRRYFLIFQVYIEVNFYGDVYF